MLDKTPQLAGAQPFFKTWYLEGVRPERGAKRPGSQSVGSGSGAGGAGQGF